MLLVMCQFQGQPAQNRLCLLYKKGYHPLAPTAENQIHKTQKTLSTSACLQPSWPFPGKVSAQVSWEVNRFGGNSFICLARVATVISQLSPLHTCPLLCPEIKAIITQGCFWEAGGTQHCLFLVPSGIPLSSKSSSLKKKKVQSKQATPDLWMSFQLSNLSPNGTWLSLLPWSFCQLGVTEDSSRRDLSHYLSRICFCHPIIPSPFADFSVGKGTPHATAEGEQRLLSQTFTSFISSSYPHCRPSWKPSQQQLHYPVLLCQAMFTFLNFSLVTKNKPKIQLTVQFLGLSSILCLIMKECNQIPQQTLV